MGKELHLLETPTGSWLKLIGLGVLVLLLVILLGELPVKAGQIDFRAYWSASYLLAHGENFADDGSLLTVQRDLAGFDRDYGMRTWNPPWILVWLLPYTLVGFVTASNLWLVTNVGALFFSVVVSWHMLFPTHTHDGMKKWLWVPVMVAILFPSTIVSIMFGQVNLLVLAGIVGFLYFYAKGQDVASGFALALTTFKPHLVYLVVPIMILQAWKERRWRVVLAFFGLLVGSTMIVFVLRPAFVTDYIQGTATGNLLAWEAATAVTYLSLKTGWLWIRLIAIVLLPLTLAGWLFLGEDWNLMTFAQIGVLASLVTTPFGWSYDFVLLLLPLTQILVWLVAERMPIAERLALILLMLIAYTVYFFQRIATPSELYFFWVPLVILAVYGWMTWRSAGSVV